MRIAPVTDLPTLERGAELFDEPIRPAAARTYLADPTHHLLFAYDDAQAPVGFVSAAELIHPDKGREMYLNELGVSEAARGAGVGTALVRALADRARQLGCTGMWGVTEPDNAAALATYRHAGANEPQSTVLLEWRFES